jgi:lipoyl(octanoyl) transferase
MILPAPLIHYRGLVSYEAGLSAMRDLTRQRTPDTPDQIWLLTHPEILTLGINGDPAHIHAHNTLPVVRCDRGGQVTWHGPGQLVVYPLLDMRRRRLGIRTLVTALESAVIQLLRHYGILGAARPEAPGVYVGDQKIASVGLRISRGCSYHGMSLNVNPDFQGFSMINPCGQPGLQPTSLERLGVGVTVEEIMPGLAAELLESLKVAATPIATPDS